MIDFDRRIKAKRHFKPIHRAKAIIRRAHLIIGDGGFIIGMEKSTAPDGFRQNPRRLKMKIEYRVRPVTRFIVTRYHESESTGGASGVETLGEYDNGDVAHQVGYALCKAEHQRLGWPLGDERIMYPENPIQGAPAQTLA